MSDVPKNLAENIRRLRTERGLSQQRIADLSEIPRATWTSLESGAANPTLSVLNRVALSLQVSIEELIGTPRTEVQFFRADQIRVRRKGAGTLRPLLPEALPGLNISRIELKAGGRLVGIPHTRGTREYLTCERGSIELAASGQQWLLEEGDSLVFRGDQRHSYRNPDMNQPTVAISVVCFAPAA